jgi:hypothetical protein
LAAGHGEGDPGAVSGDRTESQEAIQIVDTCATWLSAYDIQVTIVPHNLGLKNSINWVNRRFNDDNIIAIEVHKDAGPPSADGVSVWYEDGNNTERAFAINLSRLLSERTGKRNRGAYPDTANRHKRLGWVHLAVDSVLVECGFITSNSDLDSRDYGEALAKSLARAIGKHQPKKRRDIMIQTGKAHDWIITPGDKTLHITNPDDDTKILVKRMVFDAAGNPRKEQEETVRPAARLFWICEVTISRKLYFPNRVGGELHASRSHNLCGTR